MLSTVAATPTVVPERVGAATLWARWSRPVPTRRLAAAVALAALASLILPIPAPYGLLGLDAALLVATIVDLILVVPPAQVPVERHLPAVVSLGDTSTLSW
ncbi:MAG: hypothetical protein M3R71_05045, partial [Actinomycetota bacterium]|nr:hypothetical protein [Actinomycetota bacterium]